MINEQSIRDLIQSAGLDSFAEGIMKLIRPSIAIRIQPIDESNLKIGVSRFGGLPDLPEAIQWPTWRGHFVPFWCQLNLAEVAAFDVESALPQSGMLYFFSVMGVDDAWYWTRGFDGKDLSGWKVIYYAGEISSLRRRSVPATMPIEGRIASCSIEYSQQLSVPYGGIGQTRQVLELGLTEAQEHEYVWKVHFALDDLCDAENGVRTHQILGWPGTVQTDLSHCAVIGSGGLTWDTPIETAQLDDWRLLLELDGNHEIMSTASVYFMIRQSDLAAGNFDRVWCEEQND